MVIAQRCATATRAATLLAAAVALSGWFTTMLPGRVLTGVAHAGDVPPVCSGDCNGNGSVTVDELITMANVALARIPLSSCNAGDTNRNGSITVDEILMAVDHAAHGCVCHDTSECDAFGSLQCVEPGGFIGCGACMRYETECLIDKDCSDRGDRFICREVGPRDCPCFQPVLICAPGCAADDDCGLGEVCTPEHRCVPRPCTLDADCPSQFDCTSGEPPGGCERRPCEVDAECVDGVCVAGSLFSSDQSRRCYDQLGRCMAIPP